MAWARYGARAHPGLRREGAGRRSRAAAWGPAGRREGRALVIDERIAWDRSCRGWLSCSAALNLPNVCGNEHVASTPMAGEPRRVELAGHARGSRGSAASGLGAGVSTALGSSDRRRGDAARAHGARGRSGDHDALLCAIAAVCTTLALNGQLTVEHLIGVRTAGSTAPRADRRRLRPAAQPLFTLTPVSQDAAGSSIDAASYPSVALHGKARSLPIYLPAMRARPATIPCCIC